MKMRILLLAILVLLYCAVTVHAAVVAVAASSTSVSGAKNRIRLLLFNDDTTTTIYCNIQGGSAAVGDGVEILPKSNAFYDEQTSMPREAIACIHGGSGTKNLIIEEKTR